jgi:hypothetical protein
LNLVNFAFNVSIDNKLVNIDKNEFEKTMDQISLKYNIKLEEIPDEDAPKIKGTLPFMKTMTKEYFYKLDLESKDYKLPFIEFIKRK